MCSLEFQFHSVFVFNFRLRKKGSNLNSEFCCFSEIKDIITSFLFLMPDTMVKT